MEGGGNSLGNLTSQRNFYLGVGAETLVHELLRERLRNRLAGADLFGELLSFGKPILAHCIASRVTSLRASRNLFDSALTVASVAVSVIKRRPEFPRLRFGIPFGPSVACDVFAPASAADHPYPW